MIFQIPDKVGPTSASLFLPMRRAGGGGLLETGLYSIQKNSGTSPNIIVESKHYNSVRTTTTRHVALLFTGFISLFLLRKMAGALPFH
jgi:hypothetical protein